MTETHAESGDTAAEILIVEDDRELAALYATWLAETYSVTTTHSGEDAFEELSESIDVVVLDRRMPDISGDEVLEHIHDQHWDIRVVIVSAVRPDFDVIDMGFDEYLVKPIANTELQDVVERMLARSTYHDTVQELAQLRASTAALEAEMTEQQLAAHPEYAAAQDRIAELEADARRILEQFDVEGYRAVFRDLGRKAKAEGS